MAPTKGYRSISREECVPRRDRIILPLAALSITTALSVIILSLAFAETKLTGEDYVWTKTHHLGASIIAHILAIGLAFLQMYPLLIAIQLTARSKWTTRAFSFAELECWASLSKATFRWGSPGVMIVTALVLALSQAAGLVWFAAVLPSDTTAKINSTIAIPQYTPDPSGTFWNQSWSAFAPSSMTRVGYESYTFYPGGSMASSLLVSAAAASSNDSSAPRRHGKSSTSLYNYIGRSYGIGSSVGLASPNDLAEHTSPLLSYSYLESGYATKVQCSYNKSNDWKITLKEANEDFGYLPNLYMAEGTISPGSNVEGYAVMGFLNSNSIVALIAGGADITNNIIMAAGSDYDELDAVQCSVNFQATLFKVTTYQDSFNITVVPLGPGKDIDPSSYSQPHGRGRLQQAVLWELTRLSQRNIGLYSSLIGESLRSNVQRHLNIPDVRSATEQQLLNSVSESFEAILDDILLAISSAQFVIGPMDGRMGTTVEMTMAALVIGKRQAVFTAAALNASIMLLWLYVGVRSKWWKNTPMLNFCEVTDMLVGASRGGTAIAEEFTKQKADGDSMRVQRTFWQRLVRTSKNEQELDLRIRLVRSGHAYDTLSLAGNPTLTQLQDTLYK